MKIKGQTKKLAAGCSKHSFEVGTFFGLFFLALCHFSKNMLDYSRIVHIYF
ncbi:hypothetical protein [Streptococcus pneumoniae]|uniref:hypothetical protein n=1 Tax=Streptococcus pneumoniae TaxID=1313 RepID=UPI001F26E51D|nr:hypothetical protein [Streptococcus pneumoniae]